MLCWQREGGGVLTAFEAVSVWAAAKTGWKCFWKAFCCAEACNCLSNPSLPLSFKHTHIHTVYAHSSPTFFLEFVLVISCNSVDDIMKLEDLLSTLFRNISNIARVLCFLSCYPQGELAHSGRVHSPIVSGYSWRDMGCSCRTLYSLCWGEAKVSADWCDLGWHLLYPAHLSEECHFSIRHLEIHSQICTLFPKGSVIYNLTL